MGSVQIVSLLLSYSSLNLIVVSTQVLTGSPATVPGLNRHALTQRLTLWSNALEGLESRIETVLT